MSCLMQWVEQEKRLDAQFLVLASDLGKEKQSSWTLDMSFFNQVAFVIFLFIFVGLNWMEDDGRDPLNNCDDNIALSFWETVQKEATSWMLQAKHSTFFWFVQTRVCGAKPRLNHRRKVQKMEENGDMPQLRKLDLEWQSRSHRKEVERILGLLQTISKVSWYSCVLFWVCDWSKLPLSLTYCGEYILRFFHYKGWFCKNKAWLRQATNIGAN